MNRVDAWLIEYNKPRCRCKNGYLKNPNVEEAFKFFFPDIQYSEKHRGLDDAKHEAMIVYKLYQMGVFKID